MTDVTPVRAGPGETWEESFRRVIAASAEAAASPVERHEALCYGMLTEAMVGAFTEFSGTGLDAQEALWRLPDIIANACATLITVAVQPMKGTPPSMRAFGGQVAAAMATAAAKIEGMPSAEAH